MDYKDSFSDCDLSKLVVWKEMSTSGGKFDPQRKEQHVKSWCKFRFSFSFWKSSEHFTNFKIFGTNLLIDAAIYFSFYVIVYF